MTTVPAPYQTQEIVIGWYSEADGQEHERYLALPTGLPPARLALLVRAARWVDGGVLRWLLALSAPERMYAPDLLVALSDLGVIHRIRGANSEFACGNLEEGAAVRKPEIMPLHMAMATLIDGRGGRHAPKPCRACFATGLLMRREREEEEADSGNG